jgi:uncharacterized C2H2 Zn-finger protein
MTELDSCHKLYFFIRWSHSRLQMGSSEERQNPEQSPKMSSGFQCFVCGKVFGTNEERIEHLEKAAHGSMYDTASPQEREDTRRLQ